MSSHAVQITQELRVQRRIIISVEADTAQEAVELQREAAAPSEDAGWLTMSTLVSETVEAA